MSKESTADKLVKVIAEVSSNGVPIKVAFAEDLDTEYEIYNVCNNSDGSVSIIIKQLDENCAKTD